MGQRRAAGIIGLSVLAGIGLGFLLGRLVWPVRYVDLAPGDLSPAWQTEYIQMVALAYAYDGDLALARARLAVVGDPTTRLQQALTQPPFPLSSPARAAMARLLAALSGSGEPPPEEPPP